MSRKASHGISREASVVVSETVVPDGETATMTCPYCDRPFRRKRLRNPHVSDAHENLSDDETAAYEAAVEAEAEDLFVYHLEVAGALGMVLTALFLLVAVDFSL